MNKLQKWWRPALAIVGIVIALQVSVSLLVRTSRGHAYLIAHLERAFGRQVEVESFDARILPRPQLDANGVTVGEDPSFGYEYFLRAENLSTNLRLLGLLRGHFEFGTMALNKPSLILVRNSEGRWNLERWLPPAKTIPVQDLAVFGPASPVAPVNRLEKIEFDDGRINFKTGDDKLPFAFTGVSGSVEQILPGRCNCNSRLSPRAVEFPCNPRERSKSSAMWRELPRDCSLRESRCIGAMRHWRTSCGSSVDRIMACAARSLWTPQRKAVPPRTIWRETGISQSADAPVKSIAGIWRSAPIIRG